MANFYVEPLKIIIVAVDVIFKNNLVCFYTVNNLVCVLINMWYILHQRYNNNYKD